MCIDVKLTQHESLVALFDNQTWYKQGMSEEFEFSSQPQAWKHPQVSVFITLLLFIIMKVKSSSLKVQWQESLDVKEESLRVFLHLKGVLKACLWEG